MQKHLFLLLMLPMQMAFGQAKMDSTKLTKPEVMVKKAYSIEIPKGWTIKADCQENLCSLVAPTDTLNGVDTYLESINITVNKLPRANYTAEEYAKFSVDYLPKVVKNFKVIDKKKLKANVYVLNYKGEKNSFFQTWRQFYYVKNMKVYIITFSAESNKYDYFLPLVEASLSSFKLF